MSLKSDALEIDVSGVAKLPADGRECAAEGPAWSREVIGCR